MTYGDLVINIYFQCINKFIYSLFQSAYVEYLGMVGSDHRPIVADLDEKIIKV